MLPRIVPTLDLLPAGTPASRLLELGSEPFAESLCLPHVWPGQVTSPTTPEPAGAVARTRWPRRRHADADLRVRHLQRRDGRVPVSRRRVRRGDLLRDDRAPRDQSRLDARRDPRVLKPGGHVIVTTPNALSIERVGSVLTGRRPFVDHYSPVVRLRRPSQPRVRRVRALHGARGDRLRHRNDDSHAISGRPALPERLRRAVLRAAPASVLDDLPTSASVPARPAPARVSMALPAGAVHAAERIPVRPVSLGGDRGERRRSSATRAGSPPSSCRTAAGCAACAGSTPLPGGSAILRGAAGGSRVMVTAARRRRRSRRGDTCPGRRRPA